MTLSREGFRNIVGIIGNIISFGLFLSPTPTFYRIFKKKDVEEFQAYPYIATVLNCMFWIFYGMPFVKPDSLLVVTINGIGLVIEIIYLSIFWIYDNKRKGRKKIAYGILGELALFCLVAIPTLLCAHTHTKRTYVVGAVCVFFNILMYASPLLVMKKVIQTKSVEYMPFFLSLAGCLNGGCWTAYALIKFDPFMLTSNGFGLAGGIAQLILYACYYKSTPKNKDNEVATKQSEIQLPRRECDGSAA